MLRRSWTSGPLRSFAISCSVRAARRKYEAMVVGSGPAGITAMGNILDMGLQNVGWVDPKFTGGRINEQYREAPSNTSVKLFVGFGEGTKAFRDCVKASQEPNALDRLRMLPDQSKGTILGNPADLSLLLIKGLLQNGYVKGHYSSVAKGEYLGGLWNLTLDDGTEISSEKVVLATGSHPVSLDVHNKIPNLKELPLDTCLRPSALAEVLPQGSRVGVIGSSHSAILVIKHLFETNSTTHIKNFYRHPIKYAVPMDGWILHDNTGLKGVAAEWAREYLDHDDDQVTDRIERVCTLGANEDEIYMDRLRDCDYVVYSVGFRPNGIPTLTVEGSPVDPRFDHKTGQFYDRKSGAPVPNLYGLGIAFPEQVTDPAGNVEMNVGFAKFMKFAKRVVPEWMEKH